MYKRFGFLFAATVFVSLLRFNVECTSVTELEGTRAGEDKLEFTGAASHSERRLLAQDEEDEEEEEWEEDEEEEPMEDEEEEEEKEWEEEEEEEPMEEEEDQEDQEDQEEDEYEEDLEILGLKYLGLKLVNVPPRYTFTNFKPRYVLV
mmetsp:Transcript_12459/g.14942  ORF Transcript_12459/g.14942 Transcript_12459/m.14942 type:complete len:148 (-) Transcript_12459:146-589(-)